MTKKEKKVYYPGDDLPCCLCGKHYPEKELEIIDREDGPGWRYMCKSCDKGPPGKKGILDSILAIFPDYINQVRNQHMKYISRYEIEAYISDDIMKEQALVERMGLRSGKSVDETYQLIEKQKSELPRAIFETIAELGFNEEEFITNQRFTYAVNPLGKSSIPQSLHGKVLFRVIEEKPLHVKHVCPDLQSFIPQ